MLGPRWSKHGKAHPGSAVAPLVGAARPGCDHASALACMEPGKRSAAKAELKRM